MGIAAGRTDFGLSFAAPFKLRRRVIFLFMAISALAGALVVGLMVSRAFDERHEMRHRAFDLARTLSSSFDQEVTAYSYVLRGFSRSPALVSDDLKTFYQQMKETLWSNETWFILHDLDGQVFNTLRPYGDKNLPRHNIYPGYLEIIERIRNQRSTVSGRLIGLISGGTNVALSLRIDGADGNMKYFITTILSSKRLDAILDSPNMPPGWMAGVFDSKFDPIATVRGRIHSLDVKAAETTRQLIDEKQRGARSGYFQSIDERGIPVLVAYQRSESTEWTTRVEVPLTMLDAPVKQVLWKLVLPCALPFIVGGAGAMALNREVEQPLHALFLAELSVSELSARLLAVQEDERQRIARELHDSTTQHLIAANLLLMRLEDGLRATPDLQAASADIEREIGKALTELRIFTYLLHPPNLAKDGLQATLQEFIDGFAKRTGLEATTAIPKEVDDVSPDVQRSLLRVVQEALTNVHRHAGASRVSVQARVLSNRLVIRVRDDGVGFLLPARADGGATIIGVGIRGMNARLQQIGGRLMVRSRPTGTVVMAIVRFNR